MSQMVPAQSAPPAGRELVTPTRAALLRQLLWLAVPVLAEHMLHMVVGLTDIYLANHLPADSETTRGATAAIGSISYILWFIGLITGAIGTGSTALIARATGARNRSLANSVCGQSVALAGICGAALGVVVFIVAPQVVQMTRLSGAAAEFALVYLRLLSLALPFSTVMFVANACLRGAGDTITPAIVMMCVDVVNVIVSVALTFGLWGLPALGFTGIALGTVAALICGGVIQTVVLLVGRGGIRLFVHRLRPHWLTLKRILRIGIPSGTEGLLTWLAQFAIVIVINHLDPTNRWPAAHINAVRIESISFMSGFAFATAAATMVGQSLGMGNELRARRSAWLAFLTGGGLMTVFGLLFILFPRFPADLISGDEQTAALTAQCLFICGFAQIGFAAAMIFSGALRGAGDTLSVMLINMFSIIAVRLVAVLIVGLWMGLGLGAIWLVMSAELLIRGGLLLARFMQGGWVHVRV
jgi:putative MATE family efflux protein